MNIEDVHVQCTSCRWLEKLPYIEAYPTHHENWKCRRTGITMRLEGTQAYQICSSFVKKEDNGVFNG